ncbi:30S ribosomal protein S4 [Candidatus Campbellbacteria bacterium CG11_big_fil_rev_8_21_14_0_20_44_21]|uniref:Small ribosomal subunit protein uS4 n=1 Tax=Candidatus Campbellbacteria bacterium CG22_combo_CG10-13_8_21_14_all_43_18 TaxID=1974530 RepID=A0A2H0DX50_9BACT|nr:MAG: 30S ribosomal protein S4 [Candidatus Campbellbacteria bacterium CG22_combo_CG10-13_8_21_14_all_43_18]PIR24439.1 MAG: 30S ribosomal protein S4 [Candidatus Campbellbacteria bacterium CG11_big_fil_rev_8_21_14_0_20_44_21]
MKTGPKFKICRRLGSDIYEKCQTQKYILSESKKSRNIGKGKKRRKVLSDYGKQLLEKQKVRFTYGISEKQFKNIVKEAVSKKGKEAKEALYEILESRLDNTVYRLSLAPSRRMARQMVSHGHITVDGRKVTIPSFGLRKGHKISIREGSKNKGFFVNLDEKIKDGGAIPAWIKFDLPKREALISGRPKMSAGESLLDLNTVIEFYSK